MGLRPAPLPGKTPKPMIFYLFSLLTAVLASASALAEGPCPTVRFVKDEISLGETERHLVCGDPELPTYREIPRNQAEFHMRAFLQARGYQDPTFKVEKGVLVVDPGEKMRVRSFRVEGAPPELHPERLRHVVGEVLTPSLLDEAGDRVLKRLRAEGYPCPNVQAEAAWKTRELVVKANPGTRYKLVGVDEDVMPDVQHGVLARYHAFEMPEWYNADWLTVTRQRITTDALVQSNYFTARCPDNTNEIRVRHEVIAGPPRLVTFGIGVDTERGPGVRASWKNSRLGRWGSLLDVTGQVNYRLQEVGSYSNLYWDTSRWYWRPSVTLRRTDEPKVEAWSGDIGSMIGWSHDWHTWGIRAAAGPKLNVVRSIRGPGRKSTDFLSLAVDFRITDHAWELYRASPQEGFDLRVLADASQEDALSPFSGVLVKINFQKLWNLFYYDPPLFVIGIRGGLNTTLTSQIERVPTTYLHYIGGSENVRGFERRKLPENGALTTMFAGLEVRLADGLPLGFQPLVFVDAAKLGLRSIQVDGPLYWSPGFGIRWQSPIGVIRGTLARGFIEGDRGAYASEPGYRLYFSFGEEF